MGAPCFSHSTHTSTPETVRTPLSASAAFWRNPGMNRAATGASTSASTAAAASA